MKQLLTLIFSCFHLLLFSQKQYQHWQWAKSFGGNGNDKVTDMKIKNGFLYVTGTFSSSSITWDNTTLINQGGEDIFIAKLDTNGNTIWVRSFGGNSDEKSIQLEINSAGTMVLRCTSASNSITIDKNNLSNPANFYTTLSIDGNILNSVVLPGGPIYSDIDIDNENGVYISGSYKNPFTFNGVAIDSSYGLAGAVVLKYSNALSVWYKNVQVRANRREEIYDYDIDPYNPPVSAVVGYTPPVTGDARASMQIEYNEHDTVLYISGNVLRNAAIDGNIFINGYYFPENAKSFIYGFKISANGALGEWSNFYQTFYTFSGNNTQGFTTGLSGYNFTTSRYHSLGGYQDYTITTEKSNRKVSSLSRGYETNSFYPTVAPSAWYPFQTDETGNYLLCIEYPEVENGKRNVIVLDTNLQEIKKTFVPEINRLPLSVRAMADTHAVYFGSTFSDGIFTVNENLPGNEIILPGNGLSEILIGKYICDGISSPQLKYPYKTSYKTCNAADSVQLYLNVDDSSGAAPYTYHWNASTHFSDTTILNPKVYFGGDSIVNRLTITDANGMKFSKDFIFFSGKASDLKLVISNTNVCSNDSIVLSLEGTNFHSCQVTGMPYAAYMYSGVPTFTSMKQQIKYTAEYTHMVDISPNYEIEYLNPSPYCMTESPVTINIKRAFINTKDVYVCPGSDYSFADGTTVQNIVAPFTHTIHYTNTAGCDSNYIINIHIAPVYNKTKTRNVCSGQDYRFRNGTSLLNITRDTIYACRFANMYGCDSIINYSFHVNPVTTTIVDAPVCRGGSYTLQYINYTETIRNITQDSTYTINLVSKYYCDSIVKVKIRVVSEFEVSQNASVCRGSSYAFPDGNIINNITNDTSYVSRLTAVGGCDSSITTHIYVTGIDTSVIKNKWRLQANENAALYQWVDCVTGSAIPGATQQSYRISATGSYAVIITKDGCIDTSSCYTITAPDLLTGGKPLMSAYPVPTKGNYAVLVEVKEPGVYNLSLLDFTGIPVKRQKINLSAGKNIIQQNISTLTSGRYTLILRNTQTGEVITKTIIKI